MARVYPPLPTHLREQLEAIEPSVDGELRYYPCKATLDDGTPVDGVYVVDFRSYIRYWGVHPEDDRGKSSVDIGRVASLTESPNRLPARFANELYEAGESGMGYCVFTVEFKDGTRQAYSSGNAVDFIRYPENKWPSDVVRVKPHTGRRAKRMAAPNYCWCLYDGVVEEPSTS